jgi:hypothetical protein
MWKPAAPFNRRDEIRSGRPSGPAAFAVTLEAPRFSPAIRIAAPLPCDTRQRT